MLDIFKTKAAHYHEDFYHHSNSRTGLVAGHCSGFWVCSFCFVCFVLVFFFLFFVTGLAGFLVGYYKIRLTLAAVEKI